jgi:hypothetical protein
MMLNKSTLVRVLAVTTAAMTVGCAMAPTAISPTANTPAMQEQQDSVTPEQLMQMGSERQLLATGQTFEQMMAQVPETLSQEDGAKLLVDIDENAIQAQPFSVQQWGHHRFAFRRFHSPFFFRHRPIRFFRHHNFFFPFFFDGVHHRRFFFDDDFPFFVRHHNVFSPFAIHRPFFFNRHHNFHFRSHGFRHGGHRGRY